MKPSSIQSAVLQPISTDHVPEAGSEEPLFLPADARRRWYLGFLHHWKDYQSNVINHWESAECKTIFDELREDAIDEPRSANSTAGADDTGLARLEDKFRREVAEIVEIVYNKLLTTWTMKQADGYNPPEYILLRKAALDSKAKPRFCFRAKPVGQNLESKSRLTGHVEYLGGRPGALTWAVGEATKNSWGSLRCVLGDVAWCMLKTSTSYGFVVSSDEIMFLRFDVDTTVEEVDINILRPEMYPLFDWVDVFEEPHLWYSDPIKFTDAFDSAEGKVTVKLGLLHLIHEVVTKEWKMQDEKGKCERYFQKTESGERWISKPPRRR